MRLTARGAAILRGLMLAVALIANVPPLRAGTVTVGGPFTLIAPDGKTVTDRTYAGKWLLVYFGFTFCPNTCPTALLDIATALQKLGPDAAKVQPLFITIDPQRDTPAAMGQYTRSFDSRIIGLTGSAQQIAAVAKEFGVYYSRHSTGPGRNDYLMDHSTYIYLMAPEGKFVRGFDAYASGDEIAQGVRKAMANAGHAMNDGGASKPTIR